MILVSFILAFCSMAYELVLAQQISELTGNPYLWESAAIGFYVAGMGLGSFNFSRKQADHPLGTLPSVEFSLALVGALAPFAIEALQIIYRIYLFELAGSGKGLLNGANFFGLAASPAIMLVGYLTGFELSHLIEKSQNTIKILAIYNFGIFAAALLFAKLGVLIPPSSSLAVVASINLCIALSLSGHQLFKWLPLIGLAVAGLLISGDHLSQLRLKTFYFNRTEFTSPSEGPLQTRSARQFIPWLKEAGDYPRVKQFRSLYQVIDILPTDNPQMHINGRFQVSKDRAHAYHSHFVLGPLRALGKKDFDSALILGGGDGLTAYQILAETKAAVTMIEIDPEVLRIAREQYWLNSLNFDVFANPRLKLVIDDAFKVLRQRRQQYDAIYIDITYPFDFDSARFYSYEFLRLVQRNLTPEGFFAVGLPGNPKHHEKFKEIIVSTLQKAGFRQIVVYHNAVDTFLMATTGETTNIAPYTKIGSEAIVISEIDAAFNEEAVNSLLRPKFFGLDDPFF